MGSEVRRQVCEGCWRECRYADFRDSVPTKRKRGAHGAAVERREFLQVADDKAREVTQNISDGVGDRLTKAKILGKMHEEKQAQWERETTECFYRGQQLPDTTEDALIWVVGMGDKRFRIEVQGWSEDQWKRRERIRRPVTARTFLRWWGKARQRSLEDDLDRPNLKAPGVGIGDPWTT
jgi:hypothetical protein